MHNTLRSDRITNVSQPQVSGRIPSVEFGRVIAILLVIFIHTGFIDRLHYVGGGYGYIIDLPIWLTHSLPVAYFLLVAGYFFGKRVTDGRDPRALLRQYSTPLIQLFIIWLVVYSLCPPDGIAAVYDHGLIEALTTAVATNLSILINEHVKLLLIPRPPVYHLWFLPSLIMGLAAVTGIILLKIQKHVVALILVLYGAQLAVEIANPDGYFAFDPRQQLRSMQFILWGWWLSRYDRVSFPFALSLAAGGIVLAFTEGVILKVIFHASSATVAHHAYLGSIVMIVGLFLLALAKPDFSRGTSFPYLARFTFGVYVSHMLVIYALVPIHQKLPSLSPLWHLGYAIGVCFLALGITMVLSRLPFARITVIGGTSRPFFTRRENSVP
jgi:Uncharacterized protein conserved in bacteria